LDRNCPRYFPERPRLSFQWTADYKTDRGSHYEVPTTCQICPAAIQDPELEFLVQLDAQNRRTKEAGGVMFGTDSSKWPAWFFDSVVAIEQERVSEHNARVSAEIEEAKRR